jgi:hypothetical protein
MEKISWTDRVRNEEVLLRLKEQRNILHQRFPNFFQVGATFISLNVLRTALLLSPLKANFLRFSTTVCDTKFTLILFFLSVVRGTQFGKHCPT